MNDRKWLKENLGVVIFYGLIAGALLIWIGAGVYHHYHTPVPTTLTPITEQPQQTTPTPISDKDVNGCYTPENVRKHYGETACVDYTVGYTHETNAGTKFLDQLANYSEGFVGYIPWNSGAKTMDITALLNKNIKVSGYIQEYGGYPEIIINDYSQVGVYK